AAIDGARDYIHLETYIWREDHFGRLFAQHLRRKARAGVRVRVIVDGFGSELSWGFLEELKDDKVEVLEYRPLALISDWRSVERLSRRNHRKILIVDGRRSFCGGLNIGDEYAYSTAGSEAWRDTHLEIRGPVTAQLESLFRETWHSQGGRPYRRYPEVSRDSVADQAVLALALPSDEAGQRGTIRRHYLHAIDHAKHSIDIANAYFVPNRQFVAALEAAASRGVRVRLLLPSLRHNDVPVVQLASQHLYRRLLRSGVRIFQWPISHMHAKTAVVDGVWATVGSYNLDAISLFQNLEVVIEVVSESFGTSMTAMFEADFDRSVELDLTTWKQRGLLQQLSEPLLYRARRFL
ncbi:MAG: cardiolipin synthase ClsB, partial [Deltaproteobacteria bacterium]|nr:cardiolipin synthase ClsB [Deltaproteobacteria bacterium]